MYHILPIVLLLLDEPTVDLDPLTTYLIVSMLSNHAKRRGRIILLTMEKPRSDVFPFLDRVTYLCLGDVVYSGPTRLMLEYFNAIGFPCPQLENPLMYYRKYFFSIRKQILSFLFLRRTSIVSRVIY
jgi:ABC-type multidrug transport system ATPase subunit